MTMSSPVKRFRTQTFLWAALRFTPAGISRAGWSCYPVNINGLLIAQYLKINYSVVMSNIRFEWDPRKASANEKKHGISFEEARTVFFDENAKLIDDPDHSSDEERFVLLGLSSSLKVVLVCHCYREQGNVIRIISARKASTHESKQYR